jgi:hypothetical protein
VPSGKISGCAAAAKEGRFGVIQEALKPAFLPTTEAGFIVTKNSIWPSNFYPQQKFRFYPQQKFYCFDDFSELTLGSFHQVRRPGNRRHENLPLSDRGESEYER